MNAVRNDTTGAGSTMDLGYDRPRDPVEIWLARQWQRILGFTVGIQENFFGVGGNSLDAALVVDAILGEFGVQLPINVLNDRPTVERLAALLREHDERPPSPLIVIQGGDGTHAPLFLVHPDDGQAGIFCGLASALGEEFTVFGLQAEGLYDDAEPRRTVRAMADAYGDAIRAVRPTGPYLLGGCGVGAAIAYEMAVLLDDVRLVAAIDAGVLEPPFEPPHELPHESQLPHILADWQERGLVPPNVAPEFVARSLRVRQANRDAVRDWLPSPYAEPIDVVGDPQSMAVLPTAVVQRFHACATDDGVAAVLRERIG